MKYTLHGFSQPKLIELGLDYIDALILRYFIDFKDTNRMRREIINNQPYYWVKYEAIIEEYPILGITTKDRIYRRLKRLETIGVLKHTTVKNQGTYSYYAVGNNYFSLISDTDISVQKPNGSVLKTEGYGSETEGGTVLKTEGYGLKTLPNNPSTIYPSTINNPSTNNPLKESRDRIVKAWNSFNSKKVIRLNDTRRNKLDLLLAEYGEEIVLKAIENIKKSKWLRGENDKQWVITFDWFINIDNFTKVAEGNYTDKNTNTSKNKGKFNNYNQREYNMEDLEKKLLGWDEEEEK